MAPRRKRESPVLQLKVRGPGVRRGRIPVPDLIKICQEAQNAVAKQAEALEGRKTIHPGPTTDVIQHECTLELLGIRAGSTTLQFGLAKRQLRLPFPDSNAFGLKVIGELAAAIKSLSNGKKKPIDPGVLLELYNLGSVMMAGRVSEIQWIASAHNRTRRLVALINPEVREKIAHLLSSPRKVFVRVDGILDMADFKPEERKCRIDPAIGTAIMCTFDSDKENLIYSLLRKPVRVSGEGVLMPYTDRVESVYIRGIEPLPSLSLGRGTFFQHHPSLN